MNTKIINGIEYDISPQTQLDWANLREADLHGANLIGANLHKADLSRADLHKADLSRADLHKADLSGTDLSWADLHEANLIGANLSGTDLTGADLYGANLIGAYLIGANFRMATGILTISPIGSRGDVLVIYIYAQKLMFKTGCFNGDQNDFMNAIICKHPDPDNHHRVQYLNAITLAHQWFLANVR